MGITKKISPIPKSFDSRYPSLEGSLAKEGYHRFPGTNRTFLPYKDGMKYRTGLDTEAIYLQKLSTEEREAEIKMIKETKERLEKAIPGIDLSPTSKFYNFASDLPEDMKVSPVKIGTQDKFFSMEDAMQEITWHWMRVHPAVAPSLSAVHNGLVHRDVVQYYISDDEAEMKASYRKKQALNAAIQENERLTPTKRKQIARLMGLPVTEHTKEERVYNLVDEALKDSVDGVAKTSLFTELVKMKDDRLVVKDMVKQALASSIYRLRGNRVFEGENEVAPDEISLVELLLDPKRQDDFLALEKKLNINKIEAL